MVSWKSNWNGFAAEESINKIDEAFTNAVATHTTQSLFHEIEYKSFASYERAFLEVGLKLCPNMESKKDFFGKYVVRYNERLKSCT